jgi:hypothetical protein
MMPMYCLLFIRYTFSIFRFVADLRDILRRTNIYNKRNRFKTNVLITFI